MPKLNRCIASAPITWGNHSLYVMCWISAWTIRCASRKITSSDQRGFKSLKISAIRLCSRANKICSAVSEMIWLARPSAIQLFKFGGRKKNREREKVVIRTLLWQPKYVMRNMIIMYSVPCYRQRSMVPYPNWHRFSYQRWVATAVARNHPTFEVDHLESFAHRTTFFHRIHRLVMRQRNGSLC